MLPITSLKTFHRILKEQFYTHKIFRGTYGIIDDMFEKLLFCKSQIGLNHSAAWYLLFVSL